MFERHSSSTILFLVVFQVATGGIAYGQASLPQPTSTTGLSMSLDLGTLSGVLGVILTIVFFVIGYRQTIGARKERAAGADRDILETLLRRFTLEPAFSITFDEIERFISGKAIENRVKRSDVLTIDELWVVLYSRVVSTDYLSSKQRKPVLEKINKCFKATPHNEETLIRPTADSDRERRRESFQFIWLGLASAMMAAVSMGLTARFLVDAGSWDGSTMAAKVPLVIGSSLSLITAIALILYFRLRERLVSTKGDSESLVGRSRPQEFERRVIQRLKTIGIGIETSQRAVDLILTAKNRRIAVDLKYYVPTLRLAKSMLKRMGDYLKQYECDEAYFVVAAPIPSQIRDLNTDVVKFLDVDEFFSFVTEPEQIAAGGPRRV